MKKNRRCGSTADRWLGQGLGLALLLLGLQAEPAHATAELDRQYAMESIGYLRAWDNVDGLFAEYVHQAYKDYFSRQSRFTPQDLSKADSVLTSSKLPYNQVIDDKEILGQLARTLRVESLIRTKITKEGPRYRFVIDWLHSPKMDLLASESFTLEEPRGGKPFGIEEVRAALRKSLDTVFSKVPFKAHLTGRDSSSVTVNLGFQEKLNPGDTLIIATLDEVRKHPLLKHIVDWRLTETGRVQIEEVDEGIAFGKVIEEVPGRNVARYQKVVQILPAPVKPKADAKIQIDTEEEERKRKLDQNPRFGFGTAGLMIGDFNRQYSASSGTTGKSGGGVIFGAKADGQLWFTRNWFAELGLGFGFTSFSMKDIATQTNGTAGYGMTLFQFKGAAGFTYYTSGELFGPRLWAKLGYQSASYSMPTSTTDLTASSNFNGLFLGIGGDLPIRGIYGLLLNLDFGLINGAGETGLSSGSVNGSTYVSFFAGGYYRYTHRMTFRLGFDVLANSADFSSGNSLTHRVITLGPSLVYYF